MELGEPDAPCGARFRILLTEQNDVTGENGCRKELGSPVDILEVELLPAVPGNGRAEFEVDHQSRRGDQHPRNPNEESQPDASRKTQDRSRGSEDTCPDDTVEDQKGSGRHANLTLVLARLVVRAYERKGRDRIVNELDIH